MTRRPLLTALLAVASTVAGIAIYAYLWAASRDERDAADDAAALRDLSRGSRVSLDDGERIANALVRLHASGLAVRIAGAYHPTRAGWARVGKPLSDREIDVLRRFAEQADPAEDSVEDHRIVRWRAMGLASGWHITPAGRAVLAGEARS